MTNRSLGRRSQPFATSIFDEVQRRAVAHDAIDLGAGEPDFDGPEFVKEAAVEAIRAGCNQYSPARGLPILRRAIAEYQWRFYGLGYDPDSEITVFAGASEALFSAFQALCEPGDEVILLEPFFDAYRPAVLMAGATPRAARLVQPGFHLDAAAVERLISPRTRVIVLNDPHNPTGHVFSIEERALIAELCRRYDLLAISDQVYERLTFEEPFVPLASLPGMRERTIGIASLSKAFCVTGWKVGYACAPAAISAALRTVHQFITLCSSSPLQRAMAEALRLGDDFHQALRTSYRERRDLFCAGLLQLGFGVLPPSGTCFVLADARPLGYRTGEDLCLRLPELAGVAARPLGPFHLHGGETCGYVRFAFCKRVETLSEALARLGRANLVLAVGADRATTRSAGADTARSTTSGGEGS